MKKSALLFIPFLLIGRYKEARIYHERRNSEICLKAKVYQKQINETDLCVGKLCERVERGCQQRRLILLPSEIESQVVKGWVEIRR